MYPGVYLAGGRYRLLKQMSGTDCSQVSATWFAQDIVQGSPVVIKYANPIAAPTHYCFENILFREADILRHICDSRIAGLLASFYEEGRLHLVLQYFPGQTLKGYLKGLKRQGRWCSQAEVIDFGIQIYTILAYLHTLNRPIIHRDLKPANICRLPNGAYGLFDFGNARFDKTVPGMPHGKQGRDSGDTIQGIGTIGYAPPEQYPRKDRVVQTTPRSDIYSGAVIMHQMLSGEDPSKKSAKRRFLYSPLHRKTMPALDHLIKQALSYAPGRRPASASEMLTRLQDIRSSLSEKMDTLLICTRQ